MGSIRDTVVFRLVQVSRTMRKQAAVDLGHLGLYVGQEMFLLPLWARDGLTQSQLVAALGVEPPTVTKVVERMAKAGLLERRRDPEDGRVSRVYLTASGRALEEPVRRFWEALEQRVLAGCTPEERMLLRRLLQHMDANLS